MARNEFAGDDRRNRKRCRLFVAHRSTMRREKLVGIPKKILMTPCSRFRTVLRRVRRSGAQGGVRVHLQLRGGGRVHRVRHRLESAHRTSNR